MKKRAPGSSTRTREYPRGHAVVIGISNYQHIGVLPDAVLNDAHDLAVILTSHDYCGYEKRNLNLLIDGDATLDRIREALREMVNVTCPEDTALIFFSGHGAILNGSDGPMSAILPVDCDVSTLEDTCLGEPELSETLRSIPAQRLIVLIDACHAGGAISFKDQQPQGSLTLGYSEKSLGRLAQGVGRVLIASSRPSETSLVLDGERNSVFTRQLLEALSGQGCTSGDGLIRVFEIFNHIAKTVKYRVPGRQHPIFKASDLEDNFPVVLDRGGIKSTPFERKHGAPKEIREKLLVIMSDLYPLGPTDQEIWNRAGGDLSRINLSGTGREKWYRALRALRQGGGGAGIKEESLIAAALEDFPHHPELAVPKVTGREAVS